jgi:Arc/MetJ-type ribon-helix-helix transcriptional regulator
MTTENDVLLNVRDSPAIASAIEDLILEGEFSSKSEFIRTAIRELLNQFSSTSNSKKVIVNLATKRYNRANYFIGKGHTLNFETLFNDLLNEYINKMEEVMKKEMEMNQKIMLKKIELAQLQEISNSKFG